MPVLVVQRGHCNRTTGATGTNGEQAYATSVAEACVAVLDGRNGWTVRVILADAGGGEYAGDAFVAIHCDGSLDPSARGGSIGYRNAAGQRFGQAWKRAYAARGWTGGFRADNYTEDLHFYYGTGTAVDQGNATAFIAECGFMTNAANRALLTGPGGTTRVALAIGDALGIEAEGDDDMATPAETWAYKGQTDQHDMRQQLVDARAAAERAQAIATVNQQHLFTMEKTIDALTAKLNELAAKLG
jgi:N-acetylmuramoyl-L-alanine amidase-like protein